MAFLLPFNKPECLNLVLIRKMILNKYMFLKPSPQFKWTKKFLATTPYILEKKNDTVYYKRSSPTRLCLLSTLRNSGSSLRLSCSSTSFALGGLPGPQRRRTQVSSHVALNGNTVVFTKKHTLFFLTLDKLRGSRRGNDVLAQVKWLDISAHVTNYNLLSEMRTEHQVLCIYATIMRTMN